MAVTSLCLVLPPPITPRPILTLSCLSLIAYSVLPVFLCQRPMRPAYFPLVVVGLLIEANPPSALGPSEDVDTGLDDHRIGAPSCSTHSIGVQVKCPPR